MLKTYRKKKLTICASLLVLAILNVLKSKQNESLLGIKVNKYFSSHHEVLGAFTLETFNTDSWIINESLLQYGTIMSLREDSQIEIEAILWIAKPKDTETKFLKCFVKLNRNETILADVFELVRLQHSDHYGNLMHNAKCLLNVEQYRRVFNNQIVVSMIDLRDFGKFSNKSINLFGKVPMFFNRKLPKEKSVLMCSCALYDIGDVTYEHVLTWAKLNRAMGVKSQIYTMNYKNPNFQKLKEQHSDTVDVFDYELDTQALCKKHKARNVSECFEKHKFFFDERFQTHSFFHFHNVIMMDNCFLKAKYKYQFMSTLDIDEFVLPRLYPIDYHKKILGKLDNQSITHRTKCSKLYKKYTNTTKAYNLYEYLMQLRNIYGNNSASFVFLNHAFIPEITNRLEKLLNHPDTGNYSARDLNLNKDMTSPEDKKYLEYLRRLYTISGCIDSKHSLTPPRGPNKKFSNLIAKSMSFNHKSIFDTDLCLQVEHHHANIITPGAKYSFVAVEHGMLSHYRDTNYDYKGDLEDKWLSETIKDYVVDFEMRFFMLHHLRSS
jgi:hypothetical protein